MKGRQAAEVVFRVMQRLQIERCRGASIAHGTLYVFGRSVVKQRKRIATQACVWYSTLSSSTDPCHTGGARLGDVERGGNSYGSVGSVAALSQHSNACRGMQCAGQIALRIAPMYLLLLLGAGCRRPCPW